jgi:hypothetical protein
VAVDVVTVVTFLVCGDVVSAQNDDWRQLIRNDDDDDDAAKVALSLTEITRDDIPKPTRDIDIAAPEYYCTQRARTMKVHVCNSYSVL